MEVISFNIGNGSAHNVELVHNHCSIMIWTALVLGHLVTMLDAEVALEHLSPYYLFRNVPSETRRNKELQLGDTLSSIVL